jgi:hypothetical protein
MAAPTGSEVLVDAPSLVPPVSGLLTQVPVLGGIEGKRWLMGITFTPESIETPNFDDLCSTRVFDEPDLLDRAPAVKVAPVALLLKERCSTFGTNDGSDLIGRASRGLEVKRHWAIEREFEKGALNPANLHLAATYSGSPDPTTISLAAGAVVSPVDGLALLDEAIAASANIIGRGMIHAPAYLITQWAAHGLLRFQTISEDENARFTLSAVAQVVLAMKDRLSATEHFDGDILATLAEGFAAAVGRGVGRRDQILSPKGNIVVAGNGYEGRGPAGTVPAAHASMWAYATDWIVVVEGEASTTPGSFLEALDQNRNQVVFQRNQFFAILWAGLLHAAVQVETSTPVDTGADASSDVTDRAARLLGHVTVDTAGTDVADSDTGANSVVTSTLPADTTRRTWISGFEITGSGATVGGPIVATVTGVVGGPLNYVLGVPAGVLLGINPLVVTFPRPIPSTAVNTAIAVSCPAFGAGNTNAAVVVHGFQL